MEVKKLSFEEMENLQGEGWESGFYCASLGFFVGVATANPLVGFGYAVGCNIVNSGWFGIE